MTDQLIPASPSLLSPTGPDLDTHDVVVSWAAESRASLALTRREWWHPGITDLVGALLRGGAIHDVLEQHVRARAAAGLDRATVERDLDILADLLPLDPGERLREHPVQPLLERWILDATDREPDPCVDELTGLATPGYLKARVMEVHRQCVALGVDPGAAYGLACFAPTTRTASPFLGMTAQIRAGRVLRRWFDGGETIAHGDNGELVVLTPLTDGLEARMAQAAEDLSTHDGDLPTGVLLHRLPVDTELAADLVGATTSAYREPAR